MIRYLLVIFLSAIALPGITQNITGSWEGIMGIEKLQLNVEEKRGKLCGYTYDHWVGQPSEYCRAYFTGTYDASTKIYSFTGTRFISNSGSHDLIRLKLKRVPYNGGYVLQGYVLANSPFSAPSPITLKRVSLKPRPLADGTPVCENAPTQRKPPVPPAKPKPPVKPSEEKPKPQPPAPPVTPEKIQPKKDTAAIVKPQVPEPSYRTRINKEIRKIEVDVPRIKIAVYDNGVVDGDTVSIYFNGKLVVDKKLLSETPIEMELEVEEGVGKNELLLFAHNLGSIPPNTAVIIVTAGKQRYELLSGQDLKQNSVLFFEYKP